MQRLALIETSQRLGWVAIAAADRLIASRPLEEARRHARDLVPSLAELLAEQNWMARELTGVIVGRGPGSYTGLRVGIMSAKTLAYAAGCPLIAIDTFAALAQQAPAAATAVEIIADAQQDKIYQQRFARANGLWQPQTELQITPFTAWKDSLAPTAWVTGPGLEIFAARLAGQVCLTPTDAWLPRPESVLWLGVQRLARGERDDPFALEPLYLRPSSAEEQLSRPK